MAKRREVNYVTPEIAAMTEQQAREWLQSYSSGDIRTTVNAYVEERDRLQGKIEQFATMNLGVLQHYNNLLANRPNKERQ